MYNEMFQHMFFFLQTNQTHHFFFSMEGGELFQRIQEKQAFNERGEF